MKKKSFFKAVSVFLVAAIILCSAPLSGFADIVASAETLSGTCGDDITWSLDTETGVLDITGTGAMYDYSAYGAPWYSNRASVLKVNISDGIESIGKYAFYYCSKITSIALPYGVVSIGDGAFASCADLSSVIIPDSVKSMGKDTFFACGLTSVEIPNSVASIAYGTFRNCYYLTQVTIPSSVKSIADKAFGSCSGINFVFFDGTEDEWNSIAIGSDNVFLISSEKFFGKTEISVSEAGFTFVEGTNEATLVSYIGTETEFVIPEKHNNKPVVAIAKKAFWGCQNIVSITIPDSVTTIGENAFRNCTGLTSITIPDSVTSISDSAFSGCEGLTSITIPDSVTTIGKNAFYYCTGLTSITIPDNVTSIGATAFGCCEGLTSITIPDSVTSIGAYAFGGCKGLTSITIPDSVTSISDSAFRSCEGLTSITIPDSVTTIGEEAFYNCTGLTSITIPDSVTSIGAYAFGGCKGLTSITIPDNVTSISAGAFIYCEGLTSITIPDSVTSIGAGAFNQCKGLTSITIPDSVTSISDSAFRSCEGLTSITIPDSVKSIGDCAFYCCEKLLSIDFSDNIESIGNAAFDRTAFYNNIENWENGLLYVSSHLIASKDGLYDDHYYSSGECVIKDGTKTIAPGVFDNNGYITSVVIPEGVVSIGKDAFYYCSNLVSAVIPKSVTTLKDTFRQCDNLKVIAYSGSEEDWSKLDKSGAYSSLYSATILYNSSEVKTENGFVFSEKDDGYEVSTYIGAESDVVIPSEYEGKKVISIGDYALKNCNFTSIKIPEGITNIGDYAFFGCQKMISIEIPDTVKTIGEEAFAYCSKLVSVKIPEGVTTLEDKLFYECRSLTTVILPDSLTSIGGYAFYYCKGLTSITIPDSVTSIGSGSFYYTGIYNEAANWENSVLYIDNCLISAKTDISGKCKIKDGTTVIANKAFYSSTSLLYVVIPDTVTHIGKYAFESCNKLSLVNLSAGLKVIGDEAFWGCNSLKLVTYKNPQQSFNEIEIGTLNNALTSALSYESSFEAEITDDCLVYLAENGTVNVMMYVGEEADLVIPAEIEGIPVIAISDHVFNSGITSVEIPASVTKINYGQDASHLNNKLQKIIVDENNPVYSSDSDGVVFNKDKTELIRYPQGRKSSSTYKIPDSVTKLGDFAFAGAWYLEVLEIPSSVETIECVAKIDENGELVGFGAALERCLELKEIIVDEDNPNFSSDENGILYNKDKTELVQYPIGKKDTDYIIPEFVTKVGDTAFAHSKHLETVIIPENVSELGMGVFYACANLIGVRIDSDNITTIPRATFSSCTHLVGVSIPRSVTLIDDFAFSGTGLLGMVILPYTAVMYEGTEDEWDKITIVGEKNKDFFENVAVFEYEYSYCEHEYTSAVTKEPTCAEAGETTYTCSLCGGTYTEAIEKLAHTPGTAVKENEKAATCTEAGTYDSVVYCTVCSGEISREVVETSAALGHTEADAVKENEKKATCVEEGSYDMVVYCSVCKEEISRETKSTEKTGHKWSGWEVDVEPTMTEKGKKVRSCSVCEATEEAEIPATGITITVKDAEGNVVKEEIISGELTEVEITELADGEYIITVSQETYATRTYYVSASGGEASLEFELNKSGDINGDGKVNTIDVARANSHAKSVTKLSDYALACADINGDGKVNTIDVARVNAHARGVSSLW